MNLNPKIHPVEQVLCNMNYIWFHWPWFCSHEFWPNHVPIGSMYIPLAHHLVEFSFFLVDVYRQRLQYCAWILFGFKLGIASIPLQCTGFVLGVLPRDRFQEAFLVKKHIFFINYMFTGIYYIFCCCFFRTDLPKSESFNWFVLSLDIISWPTNTTWYQSIHLPTFQWLK